MRPYRGLTKEGKWVYGFFIETSGTSYILEKDCWDYWDEEEGQYALYGALKVIPETVGQSTGLKDKTGKEIYEGDTIKFVYPASGAGTIAQVKYSSTHTQYELIKTTGGRCEGLQEYYRDVIEIIGNVHENPKLLKD